MNTARRVAVSMLIVMAFMVVGGLMLPSQAQTQAPDTSADNTKVNTRDRDKAAPTADQQKENRSDRDITQQIRQSIVKDESLSTYAHNVKIVWPGHAEGPGTFRRREASHRGQGN